MSLESATITLTADFSEFTKSIQLLTKQFRHLGWVWFFSEFQRIGLTRPNGRPRRTGHRHRGTRAWQNRYATK